MESVTIHSRKDKTDRREIVQQAYALLDTHANFRGRAARFEFVLQDEVLIVRGSVPTFYLKQVLQTALKDIQGIRQLENHVQVVSAAGLSGVLKR